MMREQSEEEKKYQKEFRRKSIRNITIGGIIIAGGIYAASLFFSGGAKEPSPLEQKVDTTAVAPAPIPTRDVYVWQKGDNVKKIGKKFNLDSLKAYNPGYNFKKAAVGDTVYTSRLYIK